MTNAKVTNSRYVPRPSRRRGTVASFREQMLRDEQERLGVASRIRELRGHIPQPVIAEKVGVGLRGYQKWEATGGISYDNLQKLAKYHGVTVEWILHGDTEQGPTPDLGLALNGDRSDIGQMLEDVLYRLDFIIANTPELAQAFATTNPPSSRRTRRRRTP